MFLGYRANAYSQRVPIVPSYPSRIPTAPFNHNQSQGAYWLRPSLTRHRSLSDFTTEHENIHQNPWSEFATPHQNIPIWNDNFPPTKLDMTTVPCHRSNPYSYNVPSQSSLARSLSQQNIPANFSSFSNAFDSQLRTLCMGIEKRFNNNNNNCFWACKNSNMPSDYIPTGKNELADLNYQTLDFVHNNTLNRDCTTDFQWPKAHGSSSECVNTTSDLTRAFRKNIKKSVDQISGNPKNLEKWPKSLETLPKTPTDIRSKSVLSIDSNLLSNYPVFPCDPTGPTTELNRTSATGAASSHGYGHKPADRSKFLTKNNYLTGFVPLE